MSSQQTLITTHSAETLSGRISHASAGSGPAALFVHGVVLNKHLWRHQLTGLSDVRRCIAVDLLAHGDTEIAPDQDVSVTANAKMLKEVLDALRSIRSTWSATTAAEALLRFSRRSILSGCGR